MRLRNLKPMAYSPATRRATRVWRIFGKALNRSPATVTTPRGIQTVSTGSVRTTRIRPMSAYQGPHHGVQEIPSTAILDSNATSTLLAESSPSGRKVQPRDEHQDVAIPRLETLTDALRMVFRAVGKNPCRPATAVPTPASQSGLPTDDCSGIEEIRRYPRGDSWCLQGDSHPDRSGLEGGG